MKSLILLSLISLSGCSTLAPGTPKDGKIGYSLTDVTGQYQFVRENKGVENKIITRTVLATKKGGAAKIVEKTVTVSQLGTVKGNHGRSIIMRPHGSDFVVWLEGKKYESKMRLNPKKKSMTVTMTSPEAKWNGTQDIPVPHATQFCFFSQIPECLYHTQLLSRAQKNLETDEGFYIIWDSFPYTQEQYADVGKELFAPATVKFETIDQGHYRFLVEVNNQIILYHFSKSYELVKISWIAQGITVVPPGQEVTNDDE